MSNNSNGHRSKKHGSWHHIIARSIGGPDIPKNKYRWSKKKHQSCHQLFHNYLPSVAIEIIMLWTDKDGRLMWQKMGTKGFKAWQRVFVGGNPDQAIKFIQKKFLPVERKFLNGELGGDHEKIFNQG